jgi:lysophospholipase L1-like esterase
VWPRPPTTPGSAASRCQRPSPPGKWPCAKRLRITAELLDGGSFPGLAEAQLEISHHIAYHNAERRHSALGYCAGINATDMKKTYALLLLSIGVNILLSAAVAWKFYHNWFEIEVLKEPFRTSLFNAFPIRQGEVYFVGDSHTEAFELAELFHSSVMHNRGIWGDKSENMLKRMSPIVAAKPTKLFVMIGVNDICSGYSVDAIAANVEATIDEVHKGSPATRIYVQSVLPTDKEVLHSHTQALPFIQALNKRYQQLSKKPNVTFINLFPAFLEGTSLKQEYTIDRLHLNGKGYMKWRDLIAPYVNEANVNVATR